MLFFAGPNLQAVWVKWLIFTFFVETGPEGAHGPDGVRPVHEALSRSGQTFNYVATKNYFSGNFLSHL
jgi:hypothetical protein